MDKSPNLQIKKSPNTLFLDRDGVINKRLPGDYVRFWLEFEFEEGVLDALRDCAALFEIIVIVTNQQGIGKGMMTEADLAVVHHNMLEAIRKAGGRIDGIYYCPDLKSKTGNCRKPAPEMAYRAKSDFPGIEFSNAIMVGDSVSDLQFGVNLGMETVFITSNFEEVALLDQAKPPFKFPSLGRFDKLSDWVATLQKAHI